MTKITVPPLPELDFEECTDGATFACEAGYSQETVRAIQIAAARAALDAAAKVCDADHYGEWMAKAIRALRIEGET